MRPSPNEESVTTRNTYPEWVGIDEMVRLQRETFDRFLRWTTESAWHKFHRAHYDWWAFPINRRSNYGFTYTVFEEEIERLKATPAYVDVLLELARFQMGAYGWDLIGAGSMGDYREPDQRFTGETRVARLEKCARSLQLFGLCDAFQSVQAFANLLISKGVDMQWGRRNYADWWRTAVCPEASAG